MFAFCSIAQLLGVDGSVDSVRTKAAAVHLRTKGFFLFPSLLNGEAILRVAGGGVMTSMRQIEEMVSELVAFASPRGS